MSNQTTQVNANKEMKIHRHMTIDEIIKKFPNKADRLQEELTRTGLHCVGCHGATKESLEMGMLGHGFSNEAIDKLTTRLNALLEEEVNPSTITLTPRAAAKYLQILTEEGKQGWGLRLEKTGCSSYALDYSKEATEHDQEYESSGIKIHVAKAMAPKLQGITIDYIESHEGKGFKISKPKGKCGCGGGGCGCGGGGCGCK